MLSLLSAKEAMSSSPNYHLSDNLTVLEAQTELVRPLLPSIMQTDKNRMSSTDLLGYMHTYMHSH